MTFQRKHKEETINRISAGVVESENENTSRNEIFLTILGEAKALAKSDKRRTKEAIAMKFEI